MQDIFGKININNSMTKQNESFPPKMMKKQPFSNDKTKSTSYKLTELHKYYYGFYPSLSHGAEQDCLTLLRLIGAVGEKMIDWINKNNKKFNDYNSV